MTRSLVLLAVVSMLAAVCSPAVAFSPNSAAQLASIERVTEKIRELTHTSDILVQFPSSPAFNALAAASNKRDNPDADVTISQREMLLLGLLPQGVKVSSILDRLAKQVLAFYDPARRILYVRTSQSVLFGLERSVVSSEYTHALLDQHYHLLKLEPNLANVAYRNSDLVAAHRALVEGDAQTTAGLFVEKTYSPQELKQLPGLATSKGPKLPNSLQRQLDFPYTAGTRFVQHLYSSGGMSAVDAAYKRLPTSTYEILHPSAYLAHWKGVQVRMHTIIGFESWTIVDDDVFGALGYDLLLWQFLGKKIADSVTAGYRGDRYVLLSKAGQDAMRLDSVWTKHAAANAAKNAIVRSLRLRYPAAVVTSAGATTVVAPAQTVRVQVKGSKMTLVYAPTPDLANELALAIVS